MYPGEDRKDCVNVASIVSFWPEIKQLVSSDVLNVYIGNNIFIQLNNARLFLTLRVWDGAQSSVLYLPKCII